RQYQFAELGCGDAAVAADQQLAFEVAFEFVDDLADGGLSEVQRARGVQHRAVAPHLVDNHELIQLQLAGQEHISRVHAMSRSLCRPMARHYTGCCGSGISDSDIKSEYFYCLFIAKFALI